MVKVLWLSDADVKKVLNMRKALEANEEAFKAKGLNQVQMPAKLLLNFKKYEGDLRAMPAYIETLDIAGVKIVNSHPNNPEKYGLPCVMAVIVLNDPKTGSTIALMDGTYITNMRTGAAGGIAIKYLARKNSRIIGMIGAGAQARTQLMAAKEILSEIDEVRVWSRTRTSSEKFVQEMQALGFNLNFKIFDSPKDAVMGSDIIVTTTPAREPIVQNDWVNKGAHINAIGADASGKEELEPLILKRSKIIVDDFEQAWHGGEINVPVKKGLIKKEDICGELGEIIAGKKSGRISDEEITVFDSTGLAVQDVVTAYFIYNEAIKQKLGRILEL